MVKRSTRARAPVLAAAFAAFLTASSAATPGLALAAGEELPRQGSLGVQIQPVGTDLQVRQVQPRRTADRMGVRTGDVIRKINGQEVSNLPDLHSRFQEVRSGDVVVIEIERDGRRKTLRSRASEKPREHYKGAAVSYGAVPFENGLLRDILVLPTEDPGAPTVFLLQGFTCASVEAANPDDTYARLAQALVDRGIGFYRVEKSQVGDSIGGPDCTNMDFEAELRGFRAAYEHLQNSRNVPADRIFLLGHSLGGLQAPLLAADAPPRGVAVFGTVLRNWADYYQAAASFQSFIYAGKDPVRTYEAGEQGRAVIDRFFFGGQSPAEIAAATPSLEPLVRDILGWQGGEIATGGRHYRFLQSLAAVALPQAWRETKSRVLSLYGQSDLVALFDTDHELIAEIVNHYRPGTAQYMSLPNTDHDMRLVTDRRSFRSVTAETGSPPKGPFNPHVASVLAQWVWDSLDRPPVRCIEPQGTPAPADCSVDARQAALPTAA